MDELADTNSEGLRLAAALVSHRRGEGHACLDLAAAAGRSLREATGDPDADPLLLPDLESWIALLRASGVVGMPGDFTPLVLDATNRLYLHRYWRYEQELTTAILTRARRHLPVDEARLDASLSRLFPETGDEFDWQRHAVRTAAHRAFTVITGGPGTGKTRTVVWLLAALLEQADERPLRVALAAPTGKAAARIAESLRAAKAGLPGPDALKVKLPDEASTIHRLLGTIPNSPRFRHDATNPLAMDVVVVDEASMVDLALMAKLFDALPTHARVVLVGDKDQLASVEAGNVLGEICAGDDQAAGSVLAGSIVELRRNWRFTAGAGIHDLSRAVNSGDVEEVIARLRPPAGQPASSVRPAFPLEPGAPAVVWRELPSPSKLALILRESVLSSYGDALRERDPVMALTKLNRFRLLAAVRRGPFGVENLNALCESILEREGLIQRRGPWYAGRPVMVTRNDRTLHLFNGDVGIALPDTDGELRVFFTDADGKVRGFAPARLPEHETSFAMTIHKSQGSEFDHILMVLPDRDSPLLTRELIYTGLTRAKSSVELWADEPVLRAAIGRRVTRASGLRDTLWKSDLSAPEAAVS